MSYTAKIGYRVTMQPVTTLAEAEEILDIMREQGEATRVRGYVIESTVTVTAETLFNLGREVSDVEGEIESRLDGYSVSFEQTSLEVPE